MTNPTAQTIHTIGYQYRLVEQLIDELKNNGMTMLIDLRERPQSRKPGYSSRQFPRALHEAGLKYLWLGKLLGGFTCTKKQWVTGCKKLVKAAEEESVCIMCLEHDVKECHREKLCEILEETHGMKIVHL